MTDYVLKCDIKYEIEPTLKEKVMNFLSKNAAYITASFKAAYNGIASSITYRMTR